MLTLESGETLELSAIPAGASVLCPVHLDHRPSAFVVESQRGTRGVHCRTCQSTFWQADPGDYDFDAFDRLFTEKQRQEANAIEEQVEKSDNYLLRLFPPAPEINLFQRRYLGPLTYEPGITIVKSPKGSGKTEALGWLIGEIKGPSAPNGFQKMKHGRDRPKSFLLIGHRVTLINEAARRLGLQSYQDSEPTRYYVVCVNSLAFKRFDFTYDVVIIDESEQVFRHVTSDIVNDIPGGQARCFAEMKHHIAEAKSVIVLDADMSLITTQVLKILRPTDWEKQCRIIYNKPLPVEGHREVLMFKTEGQLIHDLMRSLRTGQRCFVASNSRKRVQALSVMIREEFGETRRRLVITSEESQTPKIRDFLSDVRNQILEYDVLIVSPAMGTGVDITFEDDACRIDCVYGFFEPFINTHTDIDQQLARVRNPGSVKVWFKPGRFDFETSIDTIRD